MKTIPVFFINPLIYRHPSAPLGFTKILDVNTTYEEIIGVLMQKHYLSSPTPSVVYGRFSNGDTFVADGSNRWRITLEVVLAPYSRQDVKRPLAPRFFHFFKAGETLASTGLIATEIDFLVCLGENNYCQDHTQPMWRDLIYSVSCHYPSGTSPHILHRIVHKKNIAELVAQEIAAPPSKEKPSNTSSSLGETIITDLISREATAVTNFITIATGFIALIGALRLVAKQWSKKTDSASLRRSSPHNLQRRICSHPLADDSWG